MSKQRRNVPNPGYFKVSGHAVEDRVTTARAKQRVGREEAWRHRRAAGLKTKVGEAPIEQHAEELPGTLSVRKHAARKAPAAKQPVRIVKPKAKPKAKAAAAPRPAAPKKVAAKTPAPRRAPTAREPEQRGGRIRGVARLMKAGAYHAISLGRAAIDLWRHRHDPH
jgi:hypothetical protein